MLLRMLRHTKNGMIAMVPKTAWKCAVLRTLRLRRTDQRSVHSRPPYSPDLNPIEQTFAKIKHWMHNAQKRTIEDTWRHIGQLVETIQPAECQNYLINAEYASVKT